MQNVVQPAEILNVHRIVQSIGFSAHLNLRGAHIRGGNGIHRIVRRQINQGKADYRDQNQQGDGLQDALKDIFQRISILLKYKCRAVKDLAGHFAYITHKRPKCGR